jgi:hypothetical protein
VRRDARARVFELGRRIFGENAGGTIAMLLKNCDGDAQAALNKLEELQRSDDPRTDAAEELREAAQELRREQK